MSCLWFWCRRVHTTDSDTDREGEEERPSGGGEQDGERRKKEKRRWRVGKWMKDRKQKKNEKEEEEKKTEQQPVKVGDEAEDRDRSLGLESGSPSVSAETLESAGPPVPDPSTAQTENSETLLQDVAEKTQQLQNESPGENVMETTVAEEPQAEATADLKSISLEITQQEVRQSITDGETVVVSELQDHLPLEALEKPLENLGSRTETVSELQKIQRTEEVPTVNIRLLGRKVHSNKHPDPPKDVRVKDQPDGPSRSTGGAQSHRGQRGKDPKAEGTPTETPRPEAQPDGERKTKRQEGPRRMPPRHWQREQRAEDVDRRGGQMHRKNGADDQRRVFCPRQVQTQQRTLSITICNTPQRERHQPHRVVTYQETREAHHWNRDQTTDRGSSQRGSARWRGDGRNRFCPRREEECYDGGRDAVSEGRRPEFTPTQPGRSSNRGRGRRGGHWTAQRQVWWQHDDRC